ncbi:MAG: thiol:disulfide interchange protein DsbG [Polaromonas sp.]|uniref:thiol:disulfide interchange protein DsbG n=1 Tax=Polaromonas sp. TaxID=1869339 RepID=UPI00183C8BD6|nr:thiol:disulfide interchange protein DsbG [Polaromonas sp.]NMM09772.1 thiol:disulfide interchange protein DsbG [Polaromonas sp.]
MRNLPPYPLPFFGRLAASVLLGLALSGAHNAARAADYPKQIQGAVARGIKVVKTFPAVSSLTGWVLSQGGQSSIVYTTPDGKTMLVGELIDENGKPLNAQYASQFVPPPNYSASFTELERADHVVEGTLKNPKSVLYVFFDANCPFCHFTWKALQPYEKAGLQVRWIPVAVLGETSLPKAAAIMAAKDKTAAFRTMQAQYRPGAPPTPGPRMALQPELTEKIRKNGELMEKFSISGTPGIVWKDRDGKIQVKGGMPRLSEIPNMIGLPEQKIDDPELQKFR